MSGFNDLQRTVEGRLTDDQKFLREVRDFDPELILIPSSFDETERRMMLACLRKAKQSFAHLLKMLEEERTHLLFRMQPKNADGWKARYNPLWLDQASRELYGEEE